MDLPDVVTPTPIRSIRFQDENEFFQIDAPIETPKEKSFDLRPVSAFSSGEGLPYAPEGWPNPGDIWGWKVLNRTNRAGYFTDRFLLLPISLQGSRPTRKTLRSKVDVKRYLQLNFPDMKLESFFALFSWPVPSTEQSPGKAVQSLESGEGATNEIVSQRKLKRKTKSSTPTQKKLQQKTPSVSAPTLRKSKQKTQSFSHPTEKSFEQAHVRPHLTTDQVENFDDYLATVDDMLIIPLAENSLSDHVTLATTLDNEVIENSKKKLSSLLAIDFASLVSHSDVAEVATLASQIREDPSLSVDQLFKLKLVEQVPLAGEAFLEAKGNIEEASKFFTDLEAKKLKVPSLKKEYNELKSKVAQKEDEVNFNVQAIKEIDDQIQQLQSKRNKMSSALETMQKSKVELTSRLANSANSISTLVHEIQLGLSEKPKWELKQANNARRVVEIQEKFITLRGLTF